jgi:diketogulonate reductase-like aldo/keto reductase
MLHIKKIKLNDGILLPMLAYGTATALFQQDCSRWVKMAYLDGDMTHFDCAECYGNEDSLGKAVKELGLPREEVAVVTKCEWWLLCNMVRK